MIVEEKKFIAPNGWFSMYYPYEWNEFEDSSDAFLFYNPNKWNGNFRISAFRDLNNKNDDLGDNACARELKENENAKRVEVGDYICAYSNLPFEENENKYITHLWIMGKGDTAFECSFTTAIGGDISPAEKIISTIEVRDAAKKYPPEIIYIRLSEIFVINEAYEWVSNLLKKQLSVDFQGTENDLLNMQKAFDAANFSIKERDEWLKAGIVLCCILVNSVDGIEWKTLIDGNREVPVLMYKEKVIDPMKMVWSKVKRGEKYNFIEAYDEVIALLS